SALRVEREDSVQATAAAIETKRSSLGLEHQQVYMALNITKRAYYDLKSGRTHLRLQTIAGVVRFLEDDASAEQVLEWENYAERLGPLGKLIAPRMIELGYSQKALAEQADIDEETLEGVLYGTKYPEPETLKGLAKELHLTWAELRRARQ